VQVGPIVDQILQRVRDPEGVIASRDFVRDRISDAQRLLNARFGWVLDTTTLTTEPWRLFYPIVPLLPEAQRVWYVRQGGRNLAYVPWQTLTHMEVGWPRALGPRYEIWSRIGFDTIVVWPATTAATALAIESSKITLDLVADHSEFEVRDDVVPMVADLATALVTLKMRQLAPAAEVMNTLLGRVKERTTGMA
jgi:hypothetical protein